MRFGLSISALSGKIRRTSISRVNTPRWLRLGSWFAVAAWALTIIVLSSMSGERIEEINVLHLWDKAAHFAAFAVGGVLLALALRWNTEWDWPRIVLVSIVAVSLFGATDEWHQLYTPKRSGADVRDWFADTLGAIAGAAATSRIYAQYQRKNRPAPARD
jgi:VanZ family protein